MTYLRPEKIISGGQTGADLGALLGARECGIPTGGTAPKDYRTETGNYKDLLISLGLKEHSSRAYPPRTEKNVKDSDGTLIFCYNSVSRGTKLTEMLCKKHNKPCLTVDLARARGASYSFPAIYNFLNLQNIKTLNIAGNRESVAMGLQDDVKLIVRLLWDCS